MQIRLMLTMILTTAVYAAAPAADKDALAAKALAESYVDYMHGGKALAGEVFSVKALKRAPARGFLKDKPKKTLDPRMQVGEDGKRAHLKLYPSQKTWFVLVKEQGRWVIDDTMEDTD